MNAHAFPQTVPPLTPAERVEAMLDALTLLNIRAQTCERTISVAEGTTPDSDPVLWARVDQLLEEELSAQEAVVAHARLLMADGTLDRCSEFLKAETVGRI